MGHGQGPRPTVGLMCQGGEGGRELPCPGLTCWTPVAGALGSTRPQCPDSLFRGHSHTRPRGHGNWNGIAPGHSDRGQLVQGPGQEGRVGPSPDAHGPTLELVSLAN